jgi:NADH dehydrogenase
VGVEQDVERRTAVEKGPGLDAVTGAFGYTGRYITRRLLLRGRRVRNLTGHPDRENEFGDRVTVYPLDFGRPHRLVDALRGVETLYNTYWVRFPYRGMTYEDAVRNTGALIKAAEEAGVRRIVHISITNARMDSPFPYFRGKGLVEEAVVRSGLSYAIIRPTVIFGAEDILINNIAWFLRRFPVFAVMGRGEYRVQPVFVDDVARLAVSAGQGEENVTLDAVGLETYTFDELVRLIRSSVRSRARLVHVPPRLALLLTRLVGLVLKDVVLTEDEVGGLMAGLLVSDGPPTGSTRLSEWLVCHGDILGVRYSSELERHYRS